MSNQNYWPTTITLIPNMECKCIEASLTESKAHFQTERTLPKQRRSLSHHLHAAFILFKDTSNIRKLVRINLTEQRLVLHHHPTVNGEHLQIIHKHMTIILETVKTLHDSAFQNLVMRILRINLDTFFVMKITWSCRLVFYLSSNVTCSRIKGQKLHQASYFFWLSIPPCRMASQKISLFERLMKHIQMLNMSKTWKQPTQKHIDMEVKNLQLNLIWYFVSRKHLLIV